MAEGHATIRWARMLQALIGAPLEDVKLPSRWADHACSIPGQHIEDVETRGKHLLLSLSSGMTIHCHAMMFGSWQVGEPGMTLRKEERHVRLRLRTSQHEAVFYHGPVVELLTSEELDAHEVLNALGPDLMSSDFDREEVWQRLQHADGREIGDALLDQRMVAGIGNIYKSEGLFLAGIDPRRRTGTVARDELERVWDVLIPLMRQGAKSFGGITTLPAELQNKRERNWVYRRRGQACHRCGTPIELVRQGEFERMTYFCPRCQV